MPCDPQPIRYRDAKDGDWLICEDGSVAIKGQYEQADENFFGYRPHWASCSEAESFQRKGAGGGSVAH